MNSEPAKKRITKSDLNQLAKSLYGEEASCEHVRSGNRGWYLHKGAEKTFIGANATEAFKYLQSQESVTETPASAASATPSTEAAAPVTSATEAVTPVTPVAETVASATPATEAAAPVTSAAEAVTPVTPVAETVASATPATEAVTPVTPAAETVASATEAVAPVTSATEAAAPVTPVAETVASATPSVATAALVTAEDDPDRLPVPPEEVLEILLDKFPKTFFRDPEKIRPIQKYIHKKIRRLLDYKYTKNEISAAMALYTQTKEYCQKLVLGGQRTDLEGNPCGEVSKQHQEDAKVRLAGEKPMRPAKKKIPKTPSPQLPPPALDQLVFGKMDMSVKINELPADSKTLRNGWEEFLIKTERHLVKIVVRPRTWKKLQKAAKEYPLWVANIRGKMGPRMKDGFELLTPTIQIFEKKPKEPVISDQ
ncbi:MAG: hypothetical protein DRR08_25005 [Candidatus Parabeggiatoa sp. nov. 2]|nr:MAG: hypothetical protein DRR08_25005 [Gammaproteobacteria bacterium]